MMPFDAKNTELAGLLALLCDGQIDQAECERLETLLLDDPAAQDFYRRFVALDVELAWRAAGRPAPSQFNPPASASVPPIIIEASSAFDAPASVLSPLGSFVFSYAAAVVIVGIGLLIGWVYQVSIPRSGSQESARVAPPAAPVVSRSKPKMVVVGRVTDMIDCQWSDPDTATVGYAHVPLGRKYALASGLMEITYNTGARVILQGPCTYRVESQTSGYLSLGRLTARVEKRGEGRDERERDETNQQSTIGNHQYSSSPFFSVRTPTATVTDLGTAFGVEVDKSGASKAHVYEGKVEMRAAGDGPDSAKAIRLGANESARVEIGKDRVAKVVHQPGQPSPFVLHMPRRVRIKLFSTGVNVKEGRPDPHWQLVARSDEPKFKPRPAVVVDTSNSPYLSNQSDRSQWISAVGNMGSLPHGVIYIFRTTFDLKGMRPSTAILHGRFVVDNHVRAIRLNGHAVLVPKHGYEEFGFFHAFTGDRGFVEGVNVLEIEVENGEPGLDVSVNPSSPMGLLVELEGSAISAWPEPSANILNTEQKASNN